MVPKVAKSGRSFKGAAQYYLHDKKADSADRVAWTETVNLPTDDPNRAIAHMVDVAIHADQLKQAAGIKAGRKLEKPVYTYSLAWHPDQAPTKAEQLSAARETLEVLGLSQHQALIVCHTDTKHPHVHVIVNRVDPETGKSATMSKDQIKLQKWALDYERRHGKVLCVEREKNAQEREKGQWVKDQSLSRRDHFEWKKATTQKIWEDFKADRKQTQESRRSEYDALWKRRTRRIQRAKDLVKMEWKPVWREKFKKQRKDLANFDHGVFDRIGFALSRKNRSKIIGVAEAVIAPGALRHLFLLEQEKERKDLGYAQFMAVKGASRKIHTAWQQERDALKDQHRAQDQSRYEETQSKTDSVWQQGVANDFEQAQNPQTDPEKPKRPRLRDKFRKDRDRSRRRSRPR